MLESTQFTSQPQPIRTVLLNDITMSKKRQQSYHGSDLELEDAEEDYRKANEALETKIKDLFVQIKEVERTKRQVSESSRDVLMNVLPPTRKVPSIGHNGPSDETSTTGCQKVVNICPRNRTCRASGNQMGDVNNLLESLRFHEARAQIIETEKQRNQQLQKELIALKKEDTLKAEQIAKLQKELRQVEKSRDQMYREKTLIQNKVNKEMRHSKASQSDVDKYKLIAETLQKTVDEQGRIMREMKIAEAEKLNCILEDNVRLQKALHVAGDDLKQYKYDAMLREHVQKEHLENQEREKGEILRRFRKQLELTDLLKQQKMTLESLQFLYKMHDDFMEYLQWHPHPSLASGTPVQVLKPAPNSKSE